MTPYCPKRELTRPRPRWEAGYPYHRAAGLDPALLVQPGTTGLRRKDALVYVTEGRVVELLEQGFRIEHNDGRHTVIGTMNTGSELRLTTGNYVRVFGGFDPKRGVFATSRIYKVLRNVKEVEVLDALGRKPWWRFW